MSLTQLTHELRDVLGAPKRPNKPPKRNLSVFDKHQLKIAQDTLKMSDAGAKIMGGPTKEEAREIIYKFTGKWPKASITSAVKDVDWDALKQADSKLMYRFISSVNGLGKYEASAMVEINETVAALHDFVKNPDRYDDPESHFYDRLEQVDYWLEMSVKGTHNQPSTIRVVSIMQRLDKITPSSKSLTEITDFVEDIFNTSDRVRRGPIRQAMKGAVSNFKGSAADSVKYAKNLISILEGVAKQLHPFVQKSGKLKASWKKDIPYYDTAIPNYSMASRITADVGNTIIQQIKALDRMALPAWGAKNMMTFKGGQKFIGVNFSHKGGFQMDVKGPKFRGRVLVFLTGSDTYNLVFGTIRSSEWKVKKIVDDIYAEDLVRVLDDVIG